MLRVILQSDRLISQNFRFPKSYLSTFHQSVNLVDYWVTCWSIDNRTSTEIDMQETTEHERSRLVATTVPLHHMHSASSYDSIDDHALLSVQLSRTATPRRSSTSTAPTTARVAATSSGVNSRVPRATTSALRRPSCTSATTAPASTSRSRSPSAREVSPQPRRSAGMFLYVSIHVCMWGCVCMCVVVCAFLTGRGVGGPLGHGLGALQSRMYLQGKCSWRGPSGALPSKLAHMLKETVHLPNM